MTMGEIIALYRANALDHKEPYFCGRDLAVIYANQGLREANRRGHLIADSTSSMCEVNFHAGDESIPLNPLIVNVIAAHANGFEMKLVSALCMDTMQPDWQRSGPRGRPTILIAGASSDRLHLWPRPAESGVVHLRVERLARELRNDSDQPEIRAESHEFLANWIAFKVFSRTDGEMADQVMAAQQYAEFKSEFGERHGARNEEWVRSGIGLTPAPIA